MLNLHWRDLEILRAVGQGHDTAQAIRPFTSYSSHDSVRIRCKRLADLGLLESWLDKVRAARGKPRWGSRANQRYYRLTDTGQRELDERAES